MNIRIINLYQINILSMFSQKGANMKFQSASVRLVLGAIAFYSSLSELSAAACKNTCSQSFCEGQYTNCGYATWPGCLAACKQLKQNCLAACCDDINNFCGNQQYSCQNLFNKYCPSLNYNNACGSIYGACMASSSIRQRKH